MRKLHFSTSTSTCENSENYNYMYLHTIDCIRKEGFNTLLACCPLIHDRTLHIITWCPTSSLSTSRGHRVNLQIEMWKSSLVPSIVICRLTIWWMTNMWSVKIRIHWKHQQWVRIQHSRHALSTPYHNTDMVYE